MTPEYTKWSMYQTCCIYLQHTLSSVPGLGGPAGELLPGPTWRSDRPASHLRSCPLLARGGQQGQQVGCVVKTIAWARDNFTASRQQQRDNVIELHGPKKIRQILRFRCLNGVGTTNRDITQKPTIVWPDNMVTLLRQRCRVPSSAKNKNKN